MQGKHLDYLDGWRGLAITLLLIGHFFPVQGINLGSVGVNFFFVLSGWLMTRLLFVQNTPIPLFYKRRISRIFSAHFFFVGSVVFLFLVSGRSIDWPESWAAALFVNNYFSGELGKTVMPFGHIWTLSVEEHSYILLSIIAIASRRRWVNPSVTIAFFSALFAIVGIWYWTQYSGRELWGKLIHSEVSAFGIFVSAFFMLYFRKRGIPSLPFLVYPALFFIGLAMHWWSVPSPLKTIIGVGAFALLINLLAEAPKFIQSALSFSPLRQLGVWSFSIYLWQQLFYISVDRDYLSKGVALPLAIITGIASFYLLEKPARTYLNRVWVTEAPSPSIQNESAAVSNGKISS